MQELELLLFPCQNEEIRKAALRPEVSDQLVWWLLARVISTHEQIQFALWRPVFQADHIEHARECLVDDLKKRGERLCD